MFYACDCFLWRVFSLFLFLIGWEFWLNSLHLVPPKRYWQHWEEPNWPHDSVIYNNLTFLLRRPTRQQLQTWRQWCLSMVPPTILTFIKLFCQIIPNQTWRLTSSYRQLGLVFWISGTSFLFYFILFCGERLRNIRKHV